MPKRSVAEIFSEYNRRLLSFISSRVGRLEDAEDILQDVFYQFARVDDIMNPIDNTAAWLYRVARNRITDHYRKKDDEPLPGRYDEEEDEYIFDEIADIVYGEASTPETEMFRDLFLKEIAAAVAELPKEQRVVFEMTEMGDLSVKEVAEKTNTPVNTVLSRKHYAVKFLRKRLEDLYCDVVAP